MAATYNIVTQYPDVETNGGAVARDVMVVGIQTVPHEVYFERRYARADFKPSVVKSDAIGFSGMFEALFGIAGVEAVTWGQKLNSANNLVDYVTVYFTSTSGDSSDFIEVLYRQFAPELIAPMVKKGRAALDANENA